jgi:hypothetical protein
MRKGQSILQLDLVIGKESGLPPGSSLLTLNSQSILQLDSVIGQESVVYPRSTSSIETLTGLFNQKQL